MNGVLHLSIEIGPRCDLSAKHGRCPASKRVWDREMMSVERIAEIIRAAMSLGFTGFVGFHFYNEPTLYNERIAAVMDAVPEAKYMLVSNGHAPPDPRFAWVHVSDYVGQGETYPFDNRINNYVSGQHNVGPCFRTLVECAIDYSGRVALCCQDWKMTASLGDISRGDAAAMLRLWHERAREVSLGICPPVCESCTGRQSHDEYRRLLCERGL